MARKYNQAGFAPIVIILILGLIGGSVFVAIRNNVPTQVASSPTPTVSSTPTSSSTPSAKPSVPPAAKPSSTPSPSPTSTASTPTPEVTTIPSQSPSQSPSLSPTPSPSPSPSPSPTGTPAGGGDVNGDGSINETDLRVVMQSWGTNRTDVQDQFGDGKINSLDFVSIADRISNPTTSPTPVACSVVPGSATWSSSSVIVPASVTLTATVSGNCAGKQVAFTIRENDTGLGELELDGLLDDNVQTPAANGPITGTTATTTWVAEYVSDGPLGASIPPEYHFTAQVVGEGTPAVRSNDPLLTVNQAGGGGATPTPTGMSMNGESMAMQNWQPGGKNAPNPLYDKCDDGTDVSTAHKAYYVIAYDGIKYPTWHPALVDNPITGVGKCYFGHEHGSDPQKYLHWDEIVQHFGKDQDGNGTISPMIINASTGQITPGDRAGIPFGIANDHMDQYYNQENRDSIFVRHEDHVGHKIEFVNNEVDVNTDLDGNDTASTHQMAQLSGTNGLNIPYYSSSVNNGAYQPTGVVCTHLHKFHQGTHSGDGIRNNLHEVIFHSTCQSVNVNGINAPAYYPTNTVLLTGMMSFGNPGEYLRFCFADRQTKVCPDGGSPGNCNINDPLLSKMPDAINSTSLGRNMVDKYCLDNWTTLNPGNNYFGPYEIWEGDFAVYTGNTLSDASMIAEHGRQWDVLDPVRFVDVGYQHPTRTWQKDYQFNSENCQKPGGAYDALTFVGGCNSRTSNTAWDSPQSGFRGLKRTTYFGRNRVSNQGSAQTWWTDPLGGNAVTTQFTSGLKQRISTVEADIQSVQSRVQQLYGGNNFLNDRAIQRLFNDGGNTVHAPN